MACWCSSTGVESTPAIKLQCQVSFVFFFAIISQIKCFFDIVVELHQIKKKKILHSNQAQGFQSTLYFTIGNLNIFKLKVLIMNMIKFGWFSITIVYLLNYSDFLLPQKSHFGPTVHIYSACTASGKSYYECRRYLYLVLSAYYNYGDFDDYWKLNMLIYCKLYNVVIIKSSS